VDEGFSLPAGPPVPGHDRERLERLCRYAARPAIATDRLHELPDGRLACDLRHPWSDGTTRVVLEPLTFLEKRTALIPPLRTHQVTYHGVLAPAAALRPASCPAPHRAAGAARPLMAAANAATPGPISCSAGRGDAATWTRRASRPAPAARGQRRRRRPGRCRRPDRPFVAVAGDGWVGAPQWPARAVRGERLITGCSHESRIFHTYHEPRIREQTADPRSIGPARRLLPRDPGVVCGRRRQRPRDTPITQPDTHHEGIIAMTTLKNFLADEQGLETVEYAIIAGLVVSGLVAIVVAIGNWVKSSMDGLKTDLGA